MIEVTATPAAPGDLSELLRLYRLLEVEMVAIKPVWRLTEGLAEPAADALADALGDAATDVLVGRIDGVPVGFLIGQRAGLLPQADERRMAVIRYLFTETAAREVGVADALVERFLAEQHERGIMLFDAHVSPGHRLAKNFFESNGFTARHIVMHREDE